MATSSCSKKTIKLHYGYGGTITPCKNESRLRYVGGTNGIMKVDHDISYTELVVKLWDVCGPSMCLRCKLPDHDLDSLIHVRSDEDLESVVKEYDDHCGEGDLKIRVILDDRLRIYWAKCCFNPTDFIMQIIDTI